MKRKLAGLLTALMVLSMGMTAFAQKSPGNGNSSNSSGSSSNTTTTETPTGKTEVTQVSQAIKDTAANVAKQVSPNAQVLAVVDVNYDGKIPAGGVQLSFSLAGVKAGDNMVLLHQLKDGRWEVITPDSVENGVVKATFTTLSPVAFVKLPSAQDVPAPGPNGTDNNNGANGTTNKPGATTGTSGTAAGTVAASPKTGAALPVLPVLAMVCMAGIIVCGRKVKFND